METSIKSRRYCFTIPNYTEQELESFHVLAQSLNKHHYICFGLEVAPNTGMKHIQGYIEFNEAQRLIYLQKYVAIKRDKKIFKFHIEIANGTAEENKKYVSKEGNSYEFGEPMTQGTRSDLKEIKEAVRKDPKQLNEIVHEFGNNYQQLKYAESYQKYCFIHRDPQNPPKVFWIFGRSGVGKTKLVYDTFGAENICPVLTKWPATGYVQQECFLIDDFRPDSMSFDTLLRITDRYPLSLEYKGGQIPLNSSFIIITSPVSIKETYGFNNENLKQLYRRVIEICLDNIEDIREVDLRNLDGRFIYKEGANYSHHDF